MADRPSRRTVLASGAAIAAGAGVFAVAAQNEDETPESSHHERSLEWGGQGSEHAQQTCPDAVGHWHWILTPGGSMALEEDALLTVTYEDGTETTVEGHRRGQGSGAVHFDVYKQGGGTVESAVVTFNGGGANVLLTISGGRCVPGEGDEPEHEVDTLPATAVNGGSATLHGELLDMGDFEEVSVYFEWRAVSDDDWTETAPQTMTDPGTFEQDLTGLDVDTEYEFRAVAEADGDRVVGGTLGFVKTAPMEPDVETKPATEVNGSSAILQGFLTDMGDFDEVEAFFQWRLVGAETWEETDGQTLMETGAFSAEITGIDSDATYEFRAVVTADDVEVVGETLIFVKDPAHPDVDTTPATEVNGFTAVLNGELTDMGDFDEVEVYFQWRELGAEAWMVTPHQTMTATGPFDAEIEGLESGTDYEFRAVVAFDDMKDYGEILGFEKPPDDDDDDDDDEKGPDEKDVSFEPKCRTEKRIKFVVTNGTDHTLKFSWQVLGDENGGKVTVAAGDAEAVWVKTDGATVGLYFDGDLIATADGEDVPWCEDA